MFIMKMMDQKLASSMMFCSQNQSVIWDLSIEEGSLLNTGLDVESRVDLASITFFSYESTPPVRCTIAEASS